MSKTSVQSQRGLSSLKLFLALSRTQHGLLDMATPGAAALLWLGALPPPEVVVIGLITAFAGYTAVYALNDLVDYKSDREKIHKGGLLDSAQDLDSVYIRHPLAQGLLSLQKGILWAAAWALVALVGSYLLNPVCAVIFLGGALLESVYCLLLRVTYMRTLVSGVVKTSGGVAAVFAVDPSPEPLFLTLLFSWLFLWEIGGQNVPNDWVDMEEDRRLQAKTVPARFGPTGSSVIIFGSLAIAVGISLGFSWLTDARLGPSYLAGASVVGLFILLIPAYRLLKDKAPQRASSLFNRASYYPLAMLMVVVMALAI